MTVTSDINRNDYLGNGATTAFPYTFKIFADTDLTVTDRDTDGAETPLVMGVDYTVSGVLEDGGGTVTLTAALPGDGSEAGSHKLNISRAVPALQTSDITSQGTVRANIVERALDRMTMLAQQLEDKFSRTISIPITDTDVSMELPAKDVRALTQLICDADGNVTTGNAPASGVISSAMQPVTAAATLADARARMGTSGASVSVKDYPYLATGDGSTDDTAAIQAALDDHLCVHIPAGIYLTSAPLTLRNDCHVTGDGWRNTIIYNPTTNGMKRQLAGDARDFYLADFQIASANDSVNTLVGLDLTRVNNSLFINICTRFHRIGTKMARVEGGIGNCYFNTFYSLKTLSNETGLLMADDGTGVVCNKNTFYDTQYEDVGVWTGSNGIDLSGYGNNFFGIYSGHSGGNSCVKLRSVSGNNQIFGIYGESNGTYLIDNSADTSLRKNFVYGTHIDSGTMVKLARPADTDLLISDRDGQTGRHLNAAGTASELGYKFTQNVVVTEAEPYVDLLSSSASGKRFRLASGGGGIGSVGYFILHDYASGRSPIQVKHDTETSAILSDVDGVAIKKLKTDVIAAGSLPAASAAMNGRVIIEDAGAGNRNLIIYAGGERFRIDGGANV